MLHTMDRANRVSLNHPFIVIVFDSAWLALTGL